MIRIRSVNRYVYKRKGKVKQTMARTTKATKRIESYVAHKISCMEQTIEWVENGHSSFTDADRKYNWMMRSLDNDLADVRGVLSYELIWNESITKDEESRLDNKVADAYWICKERAFDIAYGLK